MSFSLLTEPWIPLLHTNGERLQGSLHDVLLQPQQWRAINGSSPIETLSLYRLLLAICHRAIGPDPDPRLELLDSWPIQKLGSYLQQWEANFDLLHPKTPFLQVTALRDTDLKSSPWTRLALECSSGAARMIWDHSIDARPRPRSYAAMARLLVAHLQFTPGGLVKALRTSASRGPAAGLMLMLPTGQTLQETLALSMVSQTSEDFAADLPSWERPPLSLDDLRKPQNTHLEGPAHRYTLLSRAVLLQPDADQNSIVLYAEGVVANDADSPSADPMAAMISGQKGPIPLLLSEQKGFWRDFQALAGSGGATAAATVNHATAVRMDRNDPRPIELIAGGLLPDQAKIILWRLEERRIAPAVLYQISMIRATERALELAEAAGKMLGKALYILYSEWVRNSGDKDPDPKVIRGLRDSIQAITTYWSALEAAFWSFVQAIGDGAEPEEALGQWRTTIHDAAEATWNQATAALGLDSRALAAAGRSRQPFSKVLAGLKT
jgi:CRISPR system Cascade subunit CasA